MPTHSQSLYPSSTGRPSKIAIIGAGAVGTAVAYACLMRGDARDIVLHDINKPKVEAEALDMAHGIQFTPSGSIEGSDDVEIVRGADLVIVTAGAKQKPGQSRLELAGSTVDLMRKILPNLLNVAPEARFMFITNPVDVVTYAALKITGLPRNQVFGSGTVLDTSRLRYLVSRETGVATQNIHAYIAGEHGDSEVALWSSAEIGNVPLRHWGPTLSGRLFDTELREEIAKDVVNSAYKIIEGKGATNYAIGLAGSNIARAVLRDEQRVLTVSTLLEDWEGISDVCMAAPTLVGRDGAGRVLNPPLTLAERDGLTESATRLRQVARDWVFYLAVLIYWVWPRRTAWGPHPLNLRNCRLLQRTNNSDNPAHDCGVITGDRRVVLIVWEEPDVVGSSGKFFDRCLSVNHCSNKFAVDRSGLTTDDNKIAVEDACVHHGVTVDFKHEELTVTGQSCWQLEDIFDCLFGGDRSASSDSSDQGNC